MVEFSDAFYRGLCTARWMMVVTYEWFSICTHQSVGMKASAQKSGTPSQIATPSIQIHHLCELQLRLKQSKSPTHPTPLQNNFDNTLRNNSSLVCLHHRQDERSGERRVWCCHSL